MRELRQRSSDVYVSARVCLRVIILLLFRDIRTVDSLKQLLRKLSSKETVNPPRDVSQTFRTINQAI